MSCFLLIHTAWPGLSKPIKSSKTVTVEPTNNAPPNNADFSGSLKNTKPPFESEKIMRPKKYFAHL